MGVVGGRGGGGGGGGGCKGRDALTGSFTMPQCVCAHEPLRHPDPTHPLWRVRPPLAAPSPLQMLISGGQQGLDIEDMRAYVQYSGGYHAEHPVILEFWAALATFTPREQADFLRFVTSCPRPPLLGFKYLSPPLAIQLAGSMLDEHCTERLPTAATCLNLLKLPPYRTAQQIRSKLLYAIESGAGFELS